jgi:hypothetical protein
VLLRQYLKIGGELLAFNVDKSFSDVLDGLVLVDLRKTDPARLETYGDDAVLFGPPTGHGPFRDALEPHDATFVVVAMT